MTKNVCRNSPGNDHNFFLLHVGQNTEFAGDIPSDGYTVARSLGEAIKQTVSDADESSAFRFNLEMFRRGVQPRITHAVVFDEAHRASKMRLLPKLAAECRKFGISLILASQSARDFDTALYSRTIMQTLNNSSEVGELLSVCC